MTGSALISGWEAGLSIRAIVERSAQFFEAEDLVLIAIIDSSENIADLVSIREAEHRGVRPIVKSPYIVTGADFVSLVLDRRLLTGFDEIWLLDRPVSHGHPPEASLVAPEQLSDTPPKAVVSWMIDSGAHLGLGDGIGLNYVGRAATLRSLGLV